MAGVNKVILVGNVGADPEVRRTQDGRPIANFNLATSESWRDRNSGERREKTEWHKVVVYTEGLAKICEQYVRKGSKLYVEGQLQTRKWQDRDGNDRYTTEVALNGFGAVLQMLDSRDDNGGGSGRRDDRRSDRDESQRREDRGLSDRGRRTGNQDYGGGSYARDLDDDIPFEMPWR